MISSDKDNSPGTVYYAVAMSIMALITVFVPDMIVPFGIGVFCTSLGDGLAGLIGQSMNFPRNAKIYGNKTLYGTMLNFIVCGIVAGVINAEFNLGMQYFHIFVIALFATELELFSGKGLDNISVTVGSALLAYFCIHFNGAENYIVPILLTPPIIALAYKFHALTVGGIIAAIIVDLIISISLGNFGFCILLAFFVGGILVDKVKKYYKKVRQNEKNDIEKRGDCRDQLQVFANSAIASVCALLYFMTEDRLFIIAFSASLAEALADTAASGIGVISGKAYDLFRMRPCAPGISGGMSVLGTLSSLFASAVIAIITFAFGKISLLESLVVLVAGFLGAIFDSFLGSLLQVKYRCNVCGMIIEREEHCKQKTEKHSGISFINNDAVNFLGTIFSAVIASLLFIII